MAVPGEEDRLTSRILLDAFKATLAAWLELRTPLAAAAVVAAHRAWIEHDVEDPAERRDIARGFREAVDAQTPARAA